MAVTVSMSALAQSLDRSEAFLRMTLRMLALPHTQDTLSLPDAITLIRYFAGYPGDQAKLVSDLEARVQSARQRELELSVALEMLKRERDLLTTQTTMLERQLTEANRRSDRLEAKLHDLTESFAHLLDQRDRLVARHGRRKSTAIETYRNGKPVLLLKDPVTTPHPATISR